MDRGGGIGDFQDCIVIIREPEERIPETANFVGKTCNYSQFVDFLSIRVDRIPSNQLKMQLVSRSTRGGGLMQRWESKWGGVGAGLNIRPRGGGFREGLGGEV